MPETEASALLRVGAIYPQRIGLRDSAGRLLFAGVKRGAFSLYFDDEPIYHFDLDGRWQRAYIDGSHYRKGLNQTVDLIGRSRVPEGIALHRRTASRAEIDSLDDSIRAAAIDVCVGLSEGRFAIIPPPSPSAALGVEELRDLLDRVSGWDAAAWFARKERYVHIYGTHASFIPPDAQNAIVLQANDGDGQPRDAEEFAAHCRDVAEFLGRRAIQASTAFLDGESTLRRPIEQILANLEAVANVFPIRRDSRHVMPRSLAPDRPSLSGIELAFEFGEDGGTLPDLDGWRRIAGHRARRVTASLHRFGTGHDSFASVGYAKESGLAVSMVCPYGCRDAEPLAALAEVVNSLPLGRGDFVYLMNAPNPEAMAEDEVSRQLETLKASLAPTRSRGAMVKDYNPAKQWN